MARPTKAANRVWQKLRDLLGRHPITGGALMLLCFAGGAGILLSGTSADQPLSQRRGMARLLASMQLVQAFRGNPSRPVPSIWAQRFGLRRSESLWKKQGSGLWWQVWAADGQPYLVVPARLLPTNEREGLTLTSLEGLLLAGADPLHRQQIQQRLQSSPARAVPGGLAAMCLDRLATDPGVAWSPDGLASLSGPLAPLLQVARYGCLNLELNGSKLSWQGMVGRRPFEAAPAGVAQPLPATEGPDPLASNELLTIRGRALGDLLGALLSRKIIQEPLEADFKLKSDLRRILATQPFELQLRSLGGGPFQAALLIQTRLAGGQARWGESLAAIRTRLLDRGLNASTLSGPGILFRDPLRDGAVVGGWRWLNKQGQFSLGVATQPALAPVSLVMADDKAVSLVVQARPSLLRSKQLLAGRWPPALTLASSLVTRLRPFSRDPGDADWFECQGELQLGGQP